MKTILKKISILPILLLMSSRLLAGESYLTWEKIQLELEKLNLDTKALGHVQCFFTEHENSVFRKKISYQESNLNRCSGDSDITLDSKRYFAIIDYTKNSNERRMYTIDRVTGKVTTMAVAHGRFKASFINPRVSLLKNSVLKTKYYSNEINSNAPSSGFFVAGIKYAGKFGESLTLHGLESRINDNACERAVVIHKHLLVTKNQAFILSSGCPMINRNYIDQVITELKSEELESGHVTKNGGVVFIYGEREKNWAPKTCAGDFNL